MTPSEPFHIAQYNVARLRYGQDDPHLVSFGIGARMVGRAAGQTLGHIWNQQDILEGDLFVTRSVWENIAALRTFVYSGLHQKYLKRSSQWFYPGEEASLVLWPVCSGDQPTLETAEAKLELLRSRGPGDEAFDFHTAKDFAFEG